MSGDMTLEMGDRTFKYDGITLTIIGDGIQRTMSGKSLSYNDLYAFALGYSTAMNHKYWNES